jgi:hypothetical protein
MIASWTPADGAALPLAAGGADETVSGLTVATSRTLRLSSPLDALPVVLGVRGQIVQVDFAVAAAGSALAAAATDVVNELGVLAIGADDGSATILLSPAALTRRRPQRTAGRITSSNFTFVGGELVAGSGNYTGVETPETGESTDYLLDVDGSVLIDVDGTILEDAA